jgi:hypothetical protein
MSRYFIAFATIYFLGRVAFAATDVTNISPVRASKNSSAVVSTRASQESKTILGFSRLTPQIGIYNTRFVGSGVNSADQYNMAIGTLGDLGDGNAVFETGLLYRGVGSYAQREIRGIIFDSSEINLHYLSIPFVSKIYLDREALVTPYFKFGLLGSALIARQEKLYLDNKAKTNSGRDFLSSIDDLELAFFTGIGTAVKIAKETGITLEVSYLQGLTSVVPGQDIYNSALGVTGGVTGTF